MILYFATVNHRFNNAITLHTKDAMEGQFFMSSLKNLWAAHKINPAKDTDVLNTVEGLRGPETVKDTPSPSQKLEKEHSLEK